MTRHKAECDGEGSKSGGVKRRISEKRKQRSLYRCGFRLVKGTTEQKFILAKATHLALLLLGNSTVYYMIPLNF